jgi:hypothetical protein
MDFNGAVHIHKEVVELALSNYSTVWGAAKSSYDRANQEAKVRTKTVRSWLLFTKTLTIEKLYDNSPYNNFFGSGWRKYLSSELPEWLSWDEADMLDSHLDGPCRIIKQMYDSRNLSIYLNPEQAAWVTKWSEYGEEE